MFDRITAQMKIDFAKDLALLVEAGVPIYEALKIQIQSCPSRRFRRTLMVIKEDVEGGMSLGAAMRKKEEVFDMLFVSLVEIGESSGTLAQNLNVIAKWLERSVRLQTDVRNATLYPKLLFGVTAFVVAMISVVVMPRLTPLFSSLRIELPLPTQIVISVTNFVHVHWLALLIFLCSAGVFWVALGRISSIHSAKDTFYVSLPIVGSFIRQYHLARSTHMIATLYGNGIAMPEALRAAARTMKNYRYRDALAHMASAVERGEKLEVSVRTHVSLFTEMTVGLIAVGEQTGTISKTFERLSVYHQRKVEDMTRRLPVILEPALLVVLTVIIGFVASAIILPIYEFSQGVNM